MAQQVVDSSRPMKSGAAISGLGRRRRAGRSESPGPELGGVSSVSSATRPRKAAAAGRSGWGCAAARGFYGRERGPPRRIVSCVPLKHCLAAAFSTNRRTPDDTQGDQQPANQRWLGNGPYSFAPRSRTLQNGLTDNDFAGKPVIAIVNTWSDMNTCHGHLRDVAQVVKRGVWETGATQSSCLPCRSARS